MTKLAQINTVCNESTGGIMRKIQEIANYNKYETISFYGRRKGYSDLKCEKFGSFFSFWLHVIFNTIFDNQGHMSYFKTKKLVKRLREEKPDIIHLHNLHGYYLHIPTLIKYLKKEFHGQVYWTFHDCFPITGHCAHFILARCNKYQTQCKNCPNKKVYPISLIKDNSYNNYIEKKKLFNEIPNLNIIVPSFWLKDKVEKSFMKDYPIHVIPNGIDLSVFKYNKESNFRKKYNLENKKLLLGVASNWSDSKGLNEFIELTKILPNNYQLILVGLSKRQVKKYSNISNLTTIEKTKNKQELVDIYSTVDLFINLSKEETFSLVTLESLACNTPVIIYKNTPMEEFVNESNSVIISEKLDLEDIEKGLILKHKQYDYIKKYDIKVFQKNIIDLYNKRR